ncbi:MAG: hypothetical protein U0572_10855 [Phycisphaerales bacterium]
MCFAKTASTLATVACTFASASATLADTGIGDQTATNATDDSGLGAIQLFAGTVQIGCLAIWPTGADRSFVTQDVSAGFASGGAGSDTDRSPVSVKGFFSFALTDQALSLAVFASAQQDCHDGACEARITIATLEPIVFNLSEDRYVKIDAPRAARGATWRLRSLDGLIEPGTHGELPLLRAGAYTLSFEVAANDADAGLDLSLQFRPIPSADATGDGRIDEADLSFLLSSWGPQECGHPCDLVPDCEIDAFDLAALLGQWPVERRR